MKKLPLSFYQRKNVVTIARELIGKILVTHFSDQLTTGRIVETEAYAAFSDKASHAFNGKRTARNEHMYAPAGTAYVYICYGIHQMMNVVTNNAGIPDAVLIRAVEPISGIDIMLQRTGKVKADFSLTRGPGNLAKALGIYKVHSGTILLSNELFIAEDDSIGSSAMEIISGPRIGVQYAGNDALLPYRFFVRGNKYVSGG